MKLLLDQNLSFRLVSLLADVFAGSMHVQMVGLEAADDIAMWVFAADHDFVIVSKDDDFRQRALALGPPPKVVWLRLGNCSTAQVEHVLRNSVDGIVGLQSVPSAAVLVLG